MRADLLKALSVPGTQAALAQILGMTRQAVGDHQARGVIPSDASLLDMLQAYISHIREMAAGREASGELDLISERARLAKEQADRLAMANAQKRGELAPVLIIEETLARVGSQIAAILDAIPAQLRRRGAFKAADVQFVAGVIATARNAAADMEVDLDGIEDAARDREGGEEGAEELLDDAAPKPVRVGR